jgi:hypothetical protein
MSHKRLMAIGFLAFILEIGLIALWFYRAEPAMLSAMDIFKVIPLLFGINLLTGFLVRLIHKPMGLLILANSILCPIIFYASWIMWFTYWAK